MRLSSVQTGTQIALCGTMPSRERSKIRLAFAYCLVGLTLAVCQASAKDVPSCEGVLDGFTLPKNPRILVWNVHKFADPRSAMDLARLARDSDVILIQEAMAVQLHSETLAAVQPGVRWATSTTFQTGSDFTGVATGAKVFAMATDLWQSDVTEPLVGTRKSMIYSEFRLEGSENRLLVVNVHAINFVRFKNFKAHIDQVLERISKHRGPMIVGGDFNTWSPKRMKYLTESLGELKLKHVDRPREGLLELDHVFYRGWSQVSVGYAGEVDSSDHKPIILQFK